MKTTLASMRSLTCKPHTCPNGSTISSSQLNNTIGMRCGFTLVEILIVIALVAVLVGLMIPGVNRAMDASNMASSSSNLRQIGVAIFLYAGENQNQIPPAITANYMDSWIGLIEPYISQSASGGGWGFTEKHRILTCPASGMVAPLGFSQYIGNQGVMPDQANHPAAQPARLSNMRSPSEVVLVMDGILTVEGSTEPNMWQAPGMWDDPNTIIIDPGVRDGLPVDSGLKWHISYRHNGRANFLFADGSVRPLPPGVLRARNFVIPWYE